MKVRPPARAIHGAVSWGIDGSVWASFSVPGVSTAYRTDGDCVEICHRVAATLMTAADVGAEFLIAGVKEMVDPGSIADGMAEGVDQTRAQNWPGIVDLTVAGEQITARRRTFLSIKLAETTGRAAVGTMGRLAENALHADLGLAPTAVTKREIRLRIGEANALAARLTRTLGAPVVPVSGSTLVWLFAHAFQRGLVDTPPPRDHSDVGTGLRSVADNTVLYEGGRPHRPAHHRSLRQAVADLLLPRKYVEVVTEVDGRMATGYQCVAVMSAMPGEWDYPGGDGEWLARLDQLAADCDWCVRVAKVDPERSARHRGRKRNNLIGQLEEFDDPAAPPPTRVWDSLDSIDDQGEMLAANPAEHDLMATTMVALSGRSAEELDARFHELHDLLKAAGYAFHRPVGDQCALLACFHPGTAPHRALRDYGQYLMCGSLASALPFERYEVGDPYGAVLMDLWDGARPIGPVFSDPAYGPRVLDEGSSAAFLGSQGGGKSYAVKGRAWANLGRGGQVVALDRTKIEEWVRFAREIPRALPGVRAEVVRLADRSVSLDPNRMFAVDTETGEDLRRRYALGFCTTTLKLGTMSRQYMALAAAEDAVLARPDPSMAKVRLELEAMAADREMSADLRSAADDVAQKLAVLAADPLGALVFGDGTPLDLRHADCIVFSAPNLDLPTEDEYAKPHLYAELPPEKILGQGLLYLITAVARQVAYADIDRHCLCVFDEAWALTRSTAGYALLMELLKNSRKSGVSVDMSSQDGADIPAAMREEIKYWFAFKHSRAGARRALECMALPDSDEVVDMLTSDEHMTTGVCLVKMRGRVAFCRVRPALTTELDESWETNPPRLAAILRREAEAAFQGLRDIDAYQVEVGDTVRSRPRWVVGDGADVDEDGHAAAKARRRAFLAGKTNGNGKREPVR